MLLTMRNSLVTVAFAAAAATVPATPALACDESAHEPAAETPAAGTPAVEAPAAATPEYRLTIDVSESGEADAVESHTLECEPTGGDHPDADAACETITELDEPFSPVPEESVCTHVYGGPATAQVEGVWAGEDVEAEFSRANGCEIARWERLEPALPEL